MRDTVRVELPGGVDLGGTRRTDAVLRALTGFDEEALTASASAPAVTRAGLLLERCVLSIGDRPADDVGVAALAVGDREALLWHLRRHTIGERLDAVVECGSCHDKLDVELRVGDLLQPRYDRWRSVHAERLGGHDVMFRLPTGADLAAIAATARTDPEHAAGLLLRRCVSAVDGGPPTDTQLAGLRADVERRIAALDPQAETLLTTTCPSCDAQLSTALDAATFLVEELARRGRHLPVEVHTLAWQYHWSEADILGLSISRRRRYLELIDDAVRTGGGP